MSPTLGWKPRCWLAFLAVLTLALGFRPSPAQAQKDVKDLMQLIPGDAFIAVHVRYGQLRDSEWVKLLPEEIQRGLRESPIPIARGEPAVDEFIFVHYSPSTLGFGGPKVKEFKGEAKGAFPSDKRPVPDKEKSDCGPKDEKDGKDGHDEGHVHAEEFYLFRLAEKLDMEKLGKKVLKKDGPFGGTIYSPGFGMGILLLPDGKTGAFASSAQSLLQLGKGKGELTDVVNAMRKQEYVVGIAMSLSDANRKEWKAELESGQDLGPERFMVKLVRPWAEMRTGYFTLSLGKAPNVQASAVFTSEKAAATARGSLEDALVLMRVIGLSEFDRDLRYLRQRARTEEDELKVGNVHALIEALETSMRKAEVTLKGSNLEAHMTLGISAAELVAQSKELIKKQNDDPGIKAVRIREANINHLKQIGIAMHSFHDVTKALPPQAICDKKTGKPLLSWRVAILPYIEQQPLYMQFDLDQPWDSPRNKALLEKMPEIYAAPGTDPKTGETYFQVFTGKGAMFELMPMPAARFGARGTRIVAIPDGTSNTLMVVEAGKSVPWTKPEDISFDAKGKLPELGGISREGFLGLYGDASVEFHRLPINPDYLRGLILMNDGKGRK